MVNVTVHLAITLIYECDCPLVLFMNIVSVIASGQSH